ncbi:MAG: hypothetical protein GX339_02550 [Tissierellia bacterium]|nr:hypothetical protein [Tissierellia bacterium]
MNQIIILDFGNDYNQDLVKIIEEENIKVNLLPYDTKTEQIQAQENVIGLILSGGYITVKEDDLEAFDGQILKLDMPILGLGRGMQVIINQLGGTVTPAGYVYEPTPSKLTFHNIGKGIFKNGDRERTVQLGFDAKVSKLPEGFKILASGEEVKSGDDRPFGAMENPDKNIYGIQFITKPAEEEKDAQAIRNFLEMCKDYQI